MNVYSLLLGDVPLLKNAIIVRLLPLQRQHNLFMVACLPLPRNASRGYFVTVIKGTVSRDFLLPVFFMNQFPPSPRVTH
jgi:hypothetical protein